MFGIRFLMTGLFAVLVYSQAATAQDAPTPCAGSDIPCLLQTLESETGAIKEPLWRDQTRRELAKLYAHEKAIDKALAQISLIDNADTRAMTIRGIGTAAAQSGQYSAQDYDRLFPALLEQARGIDTEASRLIALRYVARAQALAGLDDAARQTALAITNASQRNKALEEIVEVEAQKGSHAQIELSLNAIDDVTFRDHALATAAHTLTDAGAYDEAVQSSLKISENPYQKAQSLLYILVKQITPEEISIK